MARNVIILGSGCAGSTAAIYTARADLAPIVLEGHEPGGQLSLTTMVENYPGFPEGISGFDLGDKMLTQAKNMGLEIMTEEVAGLDLDGVAARGRQVARDLVGQDDQARGVTGGGEAPDGGFSGDLFDDLIGHHGDGESASR